MADETKTPAATLKAATQEDMLPNESLSLIGTYIAKGSASALLRTNGRKMRKVAVGDKVGSSKVAAIETGVVHLARNGTVTPLKMPAA